MKTLLEILNSGTDYLQKAGCDEARATMQHFMAHVLKCSRTQLYLQFDRVLNERDLGILRNMLKQRAAGTPMQHILGNTEFFHRTFITDARALIPRPETEELVEMILKLPICDAPRILDMGCGSGVIGITLALELQSKQAHVILADISADALSLALENAMQLGAKVNTIQSDLFSVFAVPGDYQPLAMAEENVLAEGEETIKQEPAKFDLIVANLPYIADGEKLAPEVMNEPHSALFGGTQGWELIERFLKSAPEHLSPEGSVALEIGYDQEVKVADIMRNLGYRDIRIEKDMSGIPRFPMALCPV